MRQEDRSVLISHSGVFEQNILAKSFFLYVWMSRHLGVIQKNRRIISHLDNWKRFFLFLPSMKNDSVKR